MGHASPLEPSKRVTQTARPPRPGLSGSAASTNAPSPLHTMTAHPTQADQYGRRTVSFDAVRQFREKGVLKVTALARRSEIAQVRTVLDDLFRAQGRGYGAIPNPSRLAPALKRSPVYQACLTIAKQLLGSSTGYACDHALYKEPHGLHGTPWHQDAAFHSKYSPHNTLIFWIPLQDVTPENGCMRFIPLPAVPELLPHRPFYPGDRTSMMTEQLDEHQAVICPLQAGDATAHGPLTLHAASANTTAFIRRTWTITFTPWGRWGWLTPARLQQRARLFADSLK